jgi:hypothetical protein
MLATVSQKYHGIGEEEKKGYMKRMAQTLDKNDVKKVVKKVHHPIYA